MNARLALALAAIPIALAGGAVATHAIVPDLGAPSLALAQPLTVVTSWGGSGAIAWAVVAASLALACIPYVAILAELRERRTRELALAGSIVAAAALSIVAVCAFPFIFSSDVYAYAAYGALAALGGDPYRIHAPFDVPLQNAAFAATLRYEWPSLPTCVYGPVFVWIARELVAATHANAAAILTCFRALAATSFLASLVLILRFAPERPLLLAAAIGLNPVVLWTLAEGHNDALTFFIACAGAIVAIRYPRLGGTIAGASTLIKATGGIAALLAAYALGSRRFGSGALIAILAAVAIQITAIAVAGGYQAQVATDFIGTLQAEVAIGIKGLFALIATGFAVGHITTGARVRALAAGALAIWIVLPHPYAWYGLWLLPLAALTIETSEGAALIAATFCGFLRYLSDAVGSPPAAPWIGLAAATFPIITLIAPPLAAAWRSRPAQKTLST